jgi:hypothetical protein
MLNFFKKMFNRNDKQEIDRWSKLREPVKTMTTYDVQDYTVNPMNWHNDITPEKAEYLISGASFAGSFNIPTEKGFRTKEIFTGNHHVISRYTYYERSEGII